MHSATKAIFTTILALGLPLSSYSVSHYYDAVGRLIQVAYPEGSGIRYDYDDNDNLLSASSIAIPAPPQNLVTSSDEEAGIILSWDASEETDEYKVYRRRGSNLAWREISTVPSGTIAFIDTDTAPDTEYVYRIVAAGPDGLSAYSEPSSAISPELNIFSARLVQSTVGGDLYEIKFPAKNGSTYLLEYSGTLRNDAWSPQPYRLSPSGSESQDPLTGVNGETTLYLVVEESALPRFFRVIQDPE